MPISTERCFHCGSPGRPTNLDVTGFEHLKPDGSCYKTRYWFCSTGCYRYEVKKHIPREFDYDAEFKNTDEYDKLKEKLAKAHEVYDDNPIDCYERDLKWARRHIKSAEERWISDKRTAIHDAHHQLHHRLYLEDHHASMKEFDEREEQTKKRYAEYDKIFADKMRGFARQKEREERELQKEQEKARKLQEAEALKKAEEERWAPRPFKP
jgi:hypothetical protein